MNWKQAFALGLCSVGEYKGEPVAYLFNGVRLPKLPESVLPYAYIYTRNNAYYLEFTDTVRVAESSGNCWVNNSDTAYKLVDGVWVNTGLGNYFTVIWANVDVYHTEAAGGTLYLPATDPIPVYA